MVEHRPEVEDRVRLAEHVVHAMFEALLSLAGEDACGQGDDGHVRPARGGFDLAEWGDLVFGAAPCSSR